MTRWLFDLGNSRLKFAPMLDDGRIGTVVAVAHDGHTLPRGWCEALPAQWEASYVASVAPGRLAAQLSEQLGQRCRRVSRAVTQARLGDLRIAYADPAQLGVDRFLGLLAARARGAQACLVVGVGTALTIDLLDAAGVHRGGRIAPSPELMRQALHQRVAQLPAGGGVAVPFADVTTDALASGCEGAAVALVDDSLRQGHALLGTVPRLLVHGGGSRLLAPRFGEAALVPALVLEGLACWAGADNAAAN